MKAEYSRLIFALNKNRKLSRTPEIAARITAKGAHLAAAGDTARPLDKPFRQNSVKTNKTGPISIFKRGRRMDGVAVKNLTRETKRFGSNASFTPLLG